MKEIFIFDKEFVYKRKLSNLKSTYKKIFHKKHEKKFRMRLESHFPF